MRTRHLPVALLCWISFFFAAAQADGVSKQERRQSGQLQSGQGHSGFSQGDPLCASCPSFVVRSYAGGPSASAVLTELTGVRKELTDVWLDLPHPAVWNPPCEVVIHATRSRYLQAVGSGGGQTSGSSLVQFKDGRICQRRIDLLLDRRGELSALAHELTHVVLSDRFAGRQPPRWLDEGIALLSDSPQKQRLHQRDCRAALESGTALRLVELLTLDEFTSARQVAPFYGQSHSVVQFLASQGDRSKLLDFVGAAMDQGYDRALAVHYSLANVAELENRWRTYATH